MTPTTTPAPMTHEASIAHELAVEAALQRTVMPFPATEKHRAKLADRLDMLAGRARRLQDDLEAERTRAEALAAEVESLRSRVEAAENDASFWESRCWVARQAGVVAELARLDGAKRIAELEAGIGRLAGLVDELESTLAFVGNVLAAEKIDAIFSEGETVETLHQRIARLLGGHPAALRALITHEEGRDNG